MSNAQPDQMRVVENTLADGTRQKLVVLGNPQATDDHSTFGDRLADAVARGGGSWGFIIGATLVLTLWIGCNVLGVASFDPYPFVFLNLVLSMTAAFQAPIIMMSQNRQATKDRLSAQMDFEVNCKAEAGILGLTEQVEREFQRLHEEIARLYGASTGYSAALPPSDGVADR